MRTLKYAILGLLNQRNMTGYDLMQEFESTLNEFWNARHSQIYPELKKLTDEGMIEFDIAITGTMLEKKVYSITDTGRKDFLSWLGTHEALAETPKDVFRLRTFFLQELSAEEQCSLLADGLQKHRERLTHLRHNQEKFTSIPHSDAPDFGDYLVLLGAIMREETTCAWLEECIRLCRSNSSDETR